MITVLNSTATAPNDQFQPQARQGRENNLSWLGRVLAGEAEADHSQDRAHIVLIGGKSPVAFRLRVAQSQLRHDLAPSHWSHAALLGQIEADLGRITVYEISLEPDRGFGFPPPTNGVQGGQLQQYRDPRDTDNPLLDGVGIPSAAMLEMVFGAAGFDLTPGLESRASCPEAIWQGGQVVAPLLQPREPGSRPRRLPYRPTALESHTLL